MKRVLLVDQISDAFARYVLDHERMPSGDYSVGCCFRFAVTHAGEGGVKLESVEVTLEPKPKTTETVAGDTP